MPAGPSAQEYMKDLLHIETRENDCRARNDKAHEEMFDRLNSMAPIHSELTNIKELLQDQNMKIEIVKEEQINQGKEIASVHTKLDGYAASFESEKNSRNKQNNQALKTIGIIATSIASLIALVISFLQGKH